ncbi:MAG: glutathione S-transferase [Sulfitobacter sp.]
MKLYHSPTSPYVRKVMVLLHETGQLDDVELVSAVTTPLAPDAGLLAKNPLAKVPALERAEGPTLFDSRVICEFLDGRGDCGLYGTGARYWDLRTLEATADGILDAALLVAYEWRLRPEELRMPEWVEGQWDKVARGVAAVNERWMSELQGPLNIGQIGVACALAYLDFRHDARQWRKGNEALAEWFAAFESRPSMQATAIPKSA